MSFPNQLSRREMLRQSAVSGPSVSVSISRMSSIAMGNSPARMLARSTPVRALFFAVG